jgi:hypothetical protein
MTILLKRFTKSVPETALNEEMTEHLRHEKHRALEDRDLIDISNGIRRGADPSTCGAGPRPVPRSRLARRRCTARAAVGPEARLQDGHERLDTRGELGTPCCRCSPTPACPSRRTRDTHPWTASLSLNSVPWFGQGGWSSRDQG